MWFDCPSCGVTLVLGRVWGDLLLNSSSRDVSVTDPGLDRDDDGHWNSFDQLERHSVQEVDLLPYYRLNNIPNLVNCTWIVQYS